MTVQCATIAGLLGKMARDICQEINTFFGTPCDCSVYLRTKIMKLRTELRR